MQILNKISSLPISPVPEILTNVNQEKPSSDSQKVNRKTGSSTMDLLGGLSGTEPLSQKRNHGLEPDQTMVLKPVSEVNSSGERSSTSYQSRGEDSDCQVLDTPANLQLQLHLQLFSSSPENDSPPKLASSSKYFSSDSSNPTDDQSPSSSPPIVQRFLPPKASRDRLKPDSLSTSGEVAVNFKASGGHGGGTTMSLELFGRPNGSTDNISIQSSPHRAGYASSSGSDQSPFSLNSVPQVYS